MTLWGAQFGVVAGKLEKWKKEGREKKEKDAKRRSKALSRQKEKIDDSTRKGKIEILYTV